MRNFAMAAVLFLLSLAPTFGGTPGKIFLPDILPPDTIACFIPSDIASIDRTYSGTLFYRLHQLPEMAAFVQSLEQSHNAMANDISQTTGIPAQQAMEVLNGKLGIALVDVRITSGRPRAEFMISLTLDVVPDRNALYNAVMAALNRPEIISVVLESQGLDPKTPIRSIIQEETISGGYPPLLRLGPNIRVAIVGNQIMLYHGYDSESIKKIFDAAYGNAPNLTSTAAFRTAYQGAEMQSGMSFTYINVPRLRPIIDVMNLDGTAIQVLESLGLMSAQAVGMSGGFVGEGVRHNIYFHFPGGMQGGLLSTLAPVAPNAKFGMEAYGQVIPAWAEAFMSAHLNTQALLQELPYILQATGLVTRPGGLGGMLTKETILGVPLPEIVAAVGPNAVVRPHDDTQVLYFDNVDMAAFERIIAQMEQNAGVRFSTLQVDGQNTVNYFNRRASLANPLAPAFSLRAWPNANGRGYLYVASHPQALVSLIRDSAQGRDPISSTQDFQRVQAGLTGNYSLFYYNNSRDVYRKVYNMLLPIAAVWASASRYPVDTGLLPTAASITPAMFGCGVGVRHLPEGLSIQAYSPLGLHGLTAILLEKLVASNPIVLGYVYSGMEDLMNMLPDLDQRRQQ